MARIDARQGQLLGTRGGLGVGPADRSGEIIAGGLRAFAESRQQIENERRRDAEAEQAKTDAVIRSTAAARLRESMDQRFTEAAETYTGEDPAFLDQVNSTFDREYEAAIAALPESARDDAALQFGQVRDQYRLTALRYSTEQSRAFQLKGIGDVIDSEVRAVGKDASLLALAVDNAEQAIAAAPAALQDELRREARERLANSAIDHFIETDPAYGRDLLKDGFFGELLTPEDERRAGDVLDREMKRRDAEAAQARAQAQAQAERAYRTELADVMALQRGGFPVSPERLKLLERRGRAAGPEAVQEARATATAVRDAQILQSLPLADAETIVRGLTAGAMANGEPSMAMVLRVNAAQATLATMQQEASQEQKAAAVAARAQLAAIETRLARGQPVEDAMFEELVATAEQAGPDVAAMAKAVRDGQNDQASLESLPLGQAAQLVRGMAPLAASDDVAAIRMQAAASVVEGMRKALSEDPLAFAMRARGGVDPLDLRDPITSLKARAGQAEEAAAHYGVPVAYFTEEERDALQQQLDGDAAARANFVDALTEAGQPGMIAELMPKAPVLAHMAAIRSVGGDRDAVDDALRGDALLREQKVKNPVTAAKRAQVAPRLLSDALLLRPQVEAMATEAATAIYVARAYRSGSLDQFNSDDYKRALSSALGATGKGNDQRGGIAEVTLRGQRRSVWLPTNASADQFKRLWELMPNARFREATGGDGYTVDGRVIPVAELRKGFPVAESPGVYRIDMGIPGQPRWALREDGQPLTFRMDQVGQR